jgi:hypothetical protein
MVNNFVCRRVGTRDIAQTLANFVTMKPFLSTSPTSHVLFDEELRDRNSIVFTMISGAAPGDS